MFISGLSVIIVPVRVNEPTTRTCRENTGNNFIIRRYAMTCRVARYSRDRSRFRVCLPLFFTLGLNLGTDLIWLFILIPDNHLTNGRFVRMPVDRDIPLVWNR